MRREKERKERNEDGREKKKKEERKKGENKLKELKKKKKKDGMRKKERKRKIGTKEELNMGTLKLKLNFDLRTKTFSFSKLTRSLYEKLK